MTLINRIQNLQLRAVAADDENKVKARTGEFTTLREQITSAASNAARVAEGREELLAAGIRQGDPAQAWSSVLTVVEDIITAARTLPVDAKIDAARMQTRAVVDYFFQAQKWVEVNWKLTRQSEEPSVDDQLLDALQQGGVEVDAIREDIERATHELRVLEYRSIPEAGDYARLVRARAALSSVGERIGGLIDPEIAEIVVRAQAGGVPYSELTNEVVVGLRALGILERFRVVLK